MLNIPQLLAQELSLKPYQVKNALELFAEGATVPFIARYRKELTGEMNEVQLRELSERFTYLTELEERKSAILNAIASWVNSLTISKPRSKAACRKLNLKIYTFPIVQNDEHVPPLLEKRLRTAGRIH